MPVGGSGSNILRNRGLSVAKLGLGAQVREKIGQEKWDSAFLIGSWTGRTTFGGRHILFRARYLVRGRP